MQAHESIVVDLHVRVDELGRVHDLPVHQLYEVAIDLVDIWLDYLVVVR